MLTAEAVLARSPGVTVTLGSAFTLTDAGGNFVLLAPPAGPNMLLVDGRTASTPMVQYSPVEIQINVAATGPTRVPFPLYLPKLDTAHPINLPLDASGVTTQQVLATTPLIPGLVETIPQGTKITGPDGNPVSQITITPVPVDRSPMPFPPDQTPPMLFTIQPGGTVPSHLSLALVLLGGILLVLMIWRVNDSASLPWIPGEGFFSVAGTAAGLLGLLWLWLGVRCPRCGAKVAAAILTRERTTTWLTTLLDSRECPSCGFEGSLPRS